MSSSVDVDNRKRDILILGQGRTQERRYYISYRKKIIQLILLKVINSTVYSLLKLAL